MKRERKPLTVRQKMRERQEAGTYWKSLSTQHRGELGDALVLGEYDWRDWFYEKPSREFMNEVDYLRMLWESQ